MFDLAHPCTNCPWRKGAGESFRLGPVRIAEFLVGGAFQCHKTIDYSGDVPGPGDQPIQCAAFMAMLHRSGTPNTIMQVATRLGALDLDKIDPRHVAYDTLEDAIREHCGLTLREWLTLLSESEPEIARQIRFAIPQNQK